MLPSLGRRGDTSHRRRWGPPTGQASQLHAPRSTQGNYSPTNRQRGEPGTESATQTHTTCKFKLGETNPFFMTSNDSETDRPRRGRVTRNQPAAKLWPTTSPSQRHIRRRHFRFRVRGGSKGGGWVTLFSFCTTGPSPWLLLPPCRWSPRSASQRLCHVTEDGRGTG